MADVDERVEAIRAGKVINPRSQMWEYILPVLDAYDEQRARAERAEREVARLRETLKQALRDLQQGRVKAGPMAPGDSAYSQFSTLVVAVNDVQVQLSDALTAAADDEEV